jgi:hypothetical protein
MMHFTVDDYQALDSCQKCCCERLNLKPGTTTKVSVGYVAWAAPIGRLHCDPQFALEQMETCPVPTTGNLPPVQSDLTAFSTPVNTMLAGDLNTKISDPEAATLTFKPLVLHGPQKGVLKLAADGTFEYTPAMNYTGPDRFFFTASDGTTTSTFEALIAVGVPAGDVAMTPHIVIGKPTVDERYYQVSFPVTVAPTTHPCEIWRLTVQQGALDCACTCFTRSDCFDIGVTKC